LDEVLLIWEGLGYYSRARNLHRAAKQIVDRFDGSFPIELKDALSLAGVGEYTAGAVLSIAHGLPIPAVDGNVKRVLARYLALEEPIDRTAGLRMIRETATLLIEGDAPGTFNQAMMDLGATVCTPKSPACTSCPLVENCGAWRENLIDFIPVSSAKRAVPHHDVAVGILRNQTGDILLTKRPEDMLLGGLWELPGARCRDGESLSEALQRGVTRRTGLSVKPHRKIISVNHAFSHFKITMHAFECTDGDQQRIGEPTQEYRWVRPDDLDKVALHRAARRIIDHVTSDRSDEQPEPL
jgi:A/G-specific adenine glycosylase